MVSYAGVYIAFVKVGWMASVFLIFMGSWNGLSTAHIVIQMR
jgi:hypothetical protein